MRRPPWALTRLRELKTLCPRDRAAAVGRGRMRFLGGSAPALAAQKWVLSTMDPVVFGSDRTDGVRFHREQTFNRLENPLG